MINIGIECESIEGSESWGVGRIVKKLLENISARPKLTNEFRLFLYFKSRIPDLPFLNNTIFVKKVIGTNSFSLYYYFWLPIKLWFEKVDLVFFPNYMLSPLFRGKSLVMLTEDIYYEINEGTLPLRYKLAYKIFAGWWAAKHATKIMAISETSKQELVKLFKISPDRIKVNTLGIDPPKAISYEPSATNYLLYVGQAFSRRHLRETILAFEILAPQYPDLNLVAVGKDKYNPPILKNLANEVNERLGREAIIYKEYVPEEELNQLFAGAKLLLYVSSKEAFGLPPLEALGYGVPAVVAESKLNHEIYGNNAFFTDKFTSNSIAVTIKNALANEQKQQKIKNASKIILEKYTWAKTTDRFLVILKAAL
ncbi:MAG: hypothetical protein A2831_03430 [Candidatus Yanofskybacteria bacterium RIFCSPHIGHO2_01_FULL_44_17]|uniref:Glycosyl transferase family 1 domain-containing protein n=1 Tax=Candidatus Yanofskybacteria bacterium RIFCSPHIGHO2_01_FULL_44_17 TaxID=1802668 RepID=A0A1F8EYZ6_9BACT|nr:MAG: hypothetical protein A2831_03430 [Candidatus Yanofskybacteria bacterium RIFCSPHIGHO2_01_FULL_44_17]